MDAQRTLRRQVSCVGIGLHSGNKVNLTLKPAPADSGIRFRRTDMGDYEVPATVHNLAGIQLATGLARNEVSVETVEHLLAALVSVGIDNVAIELNSPEVPIMDGSAAPFIYLIHEAGVKRLQKPRRYLKIIRPIAISRGDKRIALYPSDHLRTSDIRSSAISSRTAPGMRCIPSSQPRFSKSRTPGVSSRRRLASLASLASTTRPFHCRCRSRARRRGSPTSRVLLTTSLRP